jgi:ribulose-phosphate 3-epimerase
MSVNPGFGGQEFITSTLEKITQTKNLIQKHSKKISISVDGGVNIENIKAIAKAGADIFIVGSAIFNSKESYKITIDKLKKQIEL